jgi:uncharacterized membrane protein
MSKGLSISGLVVGIIVTICGIGTIVLNAVGLNKSI